MLIHIILPIITITTRIRSSIRITIATTTTAAATTTTSSTTIMTVVL